jgi:restriction system protein
MIPREYLEQHSKELNEKIRKKEEEIRLLQAEVADLRKQKDAVDTLDQASQPQAAGSTNRNTASVPPGSRERTYYAEYDKPILEALVELGGRGSTDQVLRIVHSKMQPLLKPPDYDLVSGGEERWRNTARWRRNTLVKNGFLRANSPWGIWEITDAGKARLKQLS